MESNWKKLLDPKIKQFMKGHHADDVAKLALKKWPDPSWPKSLILDQIKARQKAKIKLGHVISENIHDLILPASDVIEQASSFATATYKTSLMEGRTCLDCTAGSGMDTLAFSTNFDYVNAVEQANDSAQRLKYNAEILGKKNIQIINQDIEIYIKNKEKFDWIYIDPQRRDNNKKGFYNIFDGKPNVIELLPELKERTYHVMIKTSPMLDIEKGKELLPHVKDIHVVEWQGQCKEILWILDFAQENLTAPRIHAVILNDNGVPSYHIDAKSTCDIPLSEDQLSDPLDFIYEPSPAIQKTKLFQELMQSHDLKKLSHMTHLLTSNDFVDPFPGRAFKVIGCYAPSKKALPMKKANLTVRNYPSTVEILRKELGLKEGGKDYLFACTLKSGKKTIIHGCKP